MSKAAMILGYAVAGFTLYALARHSYEIGRLYCDHKWS